MNPAYPKRPEGGKVEIDFAEGLGAFMVAEVDDQVGPGRRVLFEIGRPTARFGFGIEEDGSLICWLADERSLKKGPSFPAKCFLHKTRALGAEFRRVDNREFELRIWINDLCKTRTVSCDFSGAFEGDLVVGADLNGAKNCKFALFGMYMYPGLLTETREAELWTYLRNRFALEGLKNE